MQVSSIFRARKDGTGMLHDSLNKKEEIEVFKYSISSNDDNKECLHDYFSDGPNVGSSGLSKL